MDLLKAIQSDMPVLIATDTVYGVAALPGGAGYKRIFKLKERNIDQVLPWLVGNIDDLGVYGENLQAYTKSLALMFWPGALTLVVEASERAKSIGGVAADGTIALRMPDDDFCLGLLRLLDKPLACTSANHHGEPAPSLLKDVAPSFAQLDHDQNIAVSCPGSMSSTIVDCTGELPKVLRQGSIDQQAVLAVALLDGKISLP